MRSKWVLKIGDHVEVRPFREVLTTLDDRGQLEGVQFMPEMVPFCGKRFKVTAMMGKICGGGVGIRAVTDAPLLLLDELRCAGSSHGGCSRMCTILWKAAWVTPVDGPSFEPARRFDESESAWSYPIRTDSGAYHCQATVLPQATSPMSAAEKLRSALADIAAGEWGLGQFLKFYGRAGCNRLRSLYRRSLGGVQQKHPTPTESLALQPGEWVEIKSAREIAATLDQNHKNRGLLFSVYMAPFCGGRYRVKSRMTNFIDEHTGNMRELEHTVILEGVTCTGETTSGKCRRSECHYWREIWLKRAECSGDMLIP